MQRSALIRPVVWLNSQTNWTVLEPLGRHAHPDPVMPDQLDHSGASSTEGEHCPVEWIVLQRLLYKHG